MRATSIKTFFKKAGSFIKSNKRKIFLATKIIAAIFVLIIAVFFIFRETLLQTAIEKIAVKMQRDYDCKFQLKSATFDGFTGIKLEEVSLVPNNMEPIFKIQKIKTSVSFFNLLVGNIQLNSLEIKNGFVYLVKNEKGKNFQAFLKKNKTTKTKNLDDKLNYSDFAYSLISKFLDLIPTDMLLENLTFKLDDNGKKATVYFKKLILKDKELDSNINVQTNTFAQNWRITGFADPRNNKTDIRFFNLDTGAIKLPYFDERFNLIATFDSIRLKVDDIDLDGDELHVDGFTSIANLKVNHPKIASKDVVIKNANFDYRFLIGERFISIDSTSKVQFNKTKFQPYLSVNTETDTVFKLKIGIPQMKSQDFIESLPDGLFTNFQGMQTQGNFGFNLDFMFNINKPDAVVFESNIKKDNLKILKYGAANLSKLNGEFEYRAIIKNILQRPIYVGNSNPSYTPINQISPFLRKCVLTSEDPSFFSHRGFITEAFKTSIIQNIKTKKFSRGASTISMQLIKNVFLTREKTLSRKLEEILLVYILENNRIVAKERMLEVYFNIIEWGPNIYGIGEASNFYFQKSPADLTLNECLFLASIVPSPRKFMYKFSNDGNLSSYSLKKQQYIKNIMLRRGLISLDSTSQAPVYISGRARSMLRIQVRDTAAVIIDSLMNEEDSEFD
jgi:hypothetical protein